MFVGVQVVVVYIQTSIAWTLINFFYLDIIPRPPNFEEGFLNLYFIFKIVPRPPKLKSKILSGQVVILLVSRYTSIYSGTEPDT